MSVTTDQIHLFYNLLAQLEKKNGGTFSLANCNGRMKWPTRGVYFFFEPDEFSQIANTQYRVTRIGTHALKHGSKTTVWNRLSQHKGSARTGGGNHRGSIFRLLVGTALQKKHFGNLLPSWGLKGELKKAALQLEKPIEYIKAEELEVEKEVSKYIGKMPFLCLDVPDSAHADSIRGVIERNSIALLSLNNNKLDKPSDDWLGLHSDRDRVRASGLWNNNHVYDVPDENFLGIFRNTIEKMKPLK